MDKKTKEFLIKKGVSNPENPTQSDQKIITKIRPDEHDEVSIKDYYNFIESILPNLMKTVIELSSKSLSKDVINIFEKRMNTLNQRWLIEKDTEIMKNIQEEISKIFDRIENEGDKHKKWVLGTIGSIGTIVLLSAGVKYKDVSKKILEVGIKKIKG